MIAPSAFEQFKRGVVDALATQDARLAVIEEDVAFLKDRDASFDKRVEDAMVRAFTRVLTWKNLSKVGTLAIGILTAYDRIRVWL